MEELRSTEILDREIELDAQKKAQKILEKAQKECEDILNGVDARLEAAVAEKKAHYEEKLELLKKNASAFVPLEKERYLVSFYDNKVNNALNLYFNSLEASKRIMLLESRLKNYKAALADKNVNIKCFGGIEEKTALEIVKNNISGAVNKIETVLFEHSGEEAVKGNDFHQGLIIEAEDNSVKIRLTFDELVRELKDKYSYELAVTLFGGALPQ